MEIKISSELTQMLKDLRGKIYIEFNNDSVEYTNPGGIKIIFPRYKFILIVVDLYNNVNTDNDLGECKKWMDMIKKYFSTSYNIYRLSIGPFIGLYPISIDKYKIRFRAEEYNKRPNWRDWFIMEGVID